MFVTRWRPDRSQTRIAEKGFVLGRILNSPFVIFTLPFVWLPLQSDMGLLGQVCLLGWATGPINLTLIILVTNWPPHFICLLFTYNVSLHCIHTKSSKYYIHLQKKNLYKFCKCVQHLPIFMCLQYKFTL